MDLSPWVLRQLRGDLGVPGADRQGDLRIERIELGLDPLKPWQKITGDFLADEANGQQGSEK